MRVENGELVELSFAEARDLAPEAAKCAHRLPMPPVVGRKCAHLARCQAGKATAPSGLVVLADCVKCFALTLAIEDNRPNSHPDPSKV